VEPARIPIQGVQPASVLTRVGTVTPQPPSQVTSRHGRVETGAAGNHAHVLVANFSDETLIIPKSTVTGIAEPVSEALANLVNSGEQTGAKSPTVHRREKRNEALYSKLLQGKLDHLSQEEETPIRRPKYIKPLAFRGKMKSQREQTMSKGTLREQTNDKFCQGLKPGPYHSKRKYFLDCEGLIYRRRPENEHQLIIPSTLVADLIRENHVPDSVAHRGVKRTCKLIARRFWWPRMRETVKEYVKICDACQQMKNREFQKGEWIYLYNPARRPGLSRKYT